LRTNNVAKCDCGRGSAPDPAGGVYSGPPDPLAGSRGKRREERGREGRGAGREGKGRKRGG